MGCKPVGNTESEAGAIYYLDVIAVNGSITSDMLVGERTPKRNYR